MSKVTQNFFGKKASRLLKSKNKYTCFMLDAWTPILSEGLINRPYSFTDSSHNGTRIFVDVEKQVVTDVFNESILKAKCKIETTHGHIDKNLHLALPTKPNLVDFFTYVAVKNEIKSLPSWLIDTYKKYHFLLDWKRPFASHVEPTRFAIAMLNAASLLYELNMEYLLDLITDYVNNPIKITKFVKENAKGFDVLITHNQALGRSEKRITMEMLHNGKTIENPTSRMAICLPLYNQPKETLYSQDLAFMAMDWYDTGWRELRILGSFMIESKNANDYSLEFLAAMKKAIDYEIKKVGERSYALLEYPTKDVYYIEKAIELGLELPTWFVAFYQAPAQSYLHESLKEALAIIIVNAAIEKEIRFGKAKKDC